MQPAIQQLVFNENMMSVSSNDNKQALPEGAAAAEGSDKMEVEKSSEEEEGDVKMSQPTNTKYSMTQQYKQMTLQGPIDGGDVKQPVF